MALNYRTSGTWGPGLGRNLTPAEVDDNFFELDNRVSELEENPPAGNGIASISVDGRTFTVHYTNGTSDGPFDLPLVLPEFKQQWTPGTEYVYLDMFTVPGAGVYLVIADTYTAPPAFDPDQVDTDGPMLALLVPLLPDGQQNVFNPDIEDGEYNITIDDAGSYIRIGETCDVIIPDDAAQPDIVPGFTLSFRQTTSAPLSFVGMLGVTVNPPVGTSATARGAGATVVLIKGAANEWDLSGDLTLLEPTTELLTEAPTE